MTGLNAQVRSGGVRHSTLPLAAVLTAAERPGRKRGRIRGPSKWLPPTLTRPPVHPSTPRYYSLPPLPRFPVRDPELEEYCSPHAVGALATEREEGSSAETAEGLGVCQIEE